MLWVLWLHLPVLLCVGLLSPHGLHHVLPDISALALGAALATSPAFSRRVRTLAAVVTLVSCSAVLVHLTDGLTESHFHFFAVVAFITLYQEWLPFAVCLAYVVFHHGILGVWAPAAVFSHHAAREHPVQWAMIHGGFVVLASLASLATWRLTDVERENVERVLGAAGDGIYGVDSLGRITFVNPVLCELVGKEPAALEGVHHHDALGHGPAPSDAEASPECPLCAGVYANEPLVTGEMALRGADQASLPVEYVARHVQSGAHGAGSVITVRDLRERQALETERRTVELQRDQLASIAEASPDVALIGRSDGQFVWLNLAGRRLLGFGDTEDITVYRIEDMFSAEEMARVYREDMPVLARDGDWQGEWALETREGEQIPAWVTHHLHPEASEEHAYVTGTMRDLRSQRAEERDRRENERRLAAAEGVAGMGSWEWDLSTDRVIWSPGLYRLYGMEPGTGEETFDSWVSRVHPDDREVTLAEATAGAHTGIDITHRALRADGREIVVNTRGEVITDEHGEPVSMLGTILDITERHAAAEAVRESEERARSVIATAGDAYIQFDVDGRVTEWNAQAERTFGLARDEAVGLPLTHLVLAAHDREPFERRVGLSGEPGVESSGHERFEMTMLHRSAREFPVEVTSWTIETGETPVFSCFVRDISERQAVERAKNEFVSVVGHELRTPLTSIHGVLGLLRAGLLGDLSDRGQQMVDIAVHNTDRLVRLINDILDIERLNSGRVSLQHQQCDSAALAMRSIEARRPMAESAGVSLEIDALPGSVWADPDRLEQTLTNLLSNAIKFSSHGGTVLLTARTTGNELCFQVRDHGRGIPPEHLELIFDRFQQVDGSDAREKEGTGLGLAICRTIVEQHGGRIWAESEPGQGATMSITLPVVPADMRDHAEGGPALMVAEAPSTHVHDGSTSTTLLLVEDDQDLADVLTERFRHRGIDVHHARTAELATSMCGQLVPDLLVLDLMLPRQDGYGLVEQLRRDSRFEGLPLAVYTACDLTLADRERLRLGETQFFTKGRVTPEQFERHVVARLDRLHRGAQEPASA
jgi:PAS domain S-box-containing protein